MTAVEWLYETLWKQTDFSLPNNILEQAKEIEKQQIKDAYHKGHADAISVFNTKYEPAQYYNEKFNKQTL